MDGLTIIDWNVQNRNTDNWEKRRISLREVLAREDPDLLCVQEAHRPQLDFIRTVLPEHVEVGVPRDGDLERGEYCAILFRAGRFSSLESGTFWLSDTPDVPSVTWGHEYIRICTWCRLDTGEGTMLVANTHFPLLPGPREKAARLIVQRVAELRGRDTDAVIVTGDFNCCPGSEPWATIGAAGFTSAEGAAGIPGHSPTCHHRGEPAGCIDAIFVSRPEIVRSFHILTDSGSGGYPSDHYGLVAELSPGAPLFRMAGTHGNGDTHVRPCTPTRQSVRP